MPNESPWREEYRAVLDAAAAHGIALRVRLAREGRAPDLSLYYLQSTKHAPGVLQLAEHKPGAAWILAEGPRVFGAGRDNASLFNWLHAQSQDLPILSTAPQSRSTRAAFAHSGSL